MTYHRIIMADGWSVGKRIALHHSSDDGDFPNDDVELIRGCFMRGHPMIAVHTCRTDSASWDSVVRMDPFFKDVMVIDTTEKFVEILRRNEVPGSDVVAQYILNLTECDMRRLSLLLHICDEEYILDCGYSLFEDGVDIVDGSSKFKKLENALETGYLTREEDGRIRPKASRQSAEARIITSSDGLNRRSIIQKVVEACKEMTASELEKMIRSENPESMVSRMGH